MSKVGEGSGQPVKTGFKAKASSVLKSIKKAISPELRREAKLAMLIARGEKQRNDLNERARNEEIDKIISKDAPSSSDLKKNQQFQVLPAVGDLEARKAAGLPEEKFVGAKAEKVLGAVEKRGSERAQQMLGTAPKTPFVRKGSQNRGQDGGMGGR
jgi:hypothetical protein